MTKHNYFVDASDVAVFDPRAPRTFWLDGNSVMCACPDCRAPISIRLWLMVADCWKCGCSVELTAAQEREIHSILQQQKPAQSRLTPDKPSSAPTQTETKSPPLPRTRPKSPPRQRRRKQLPLTSVPERLAPLRQPHKPRTLRDYFDQTPAWLISMLFHMAILALAALFFLDGDGPEDPYITLSTEANRTRTSGGQVEFQSTKDDFHYDLPVPDADQPTSLQRAALAQANQVAKQLRVDPAASLPQLPSLQQVKQKLRSTDSNARTLAARDPRVRVEMIKREGGTTLTEAAVARGLRWLSQHQNPDGSWSLHRFATTPYCRGQCHDRGSIDSDSAGTSLSLLPFLGAGQTHQFGIYRNNVAKGLRWLLEHQEANGDLRAGSAGNAGMYAHGQGAIVLCEAYALTGDEQLRDAAQRAIDFTVAAQHDAGGWRYKPGSEGDTSVLGWQLMAMQSARAAQLDVPQDAFTLAYAYLDSVQYHDGSQYSYQPQRRPTHVMTAEALLCRMYLGWRKDFASLKLGVDHLSREHMPGQDGYNFYYWYYATQVMHHYGGKPWKKWNISMRDILVDSQVKRGHEAGSWDPKGGHASQAGRIYSTALAVCTLEVYYRHAPIFRQLDL